MTTEPRRARETVTGYAIFWVAWALAGIGVELWALFRSYRAGGTLSQVVRRWVTGQSRPAVIPASAAWAGRIIILAFFAWLGPHLAFGWWG